MTLKSMYAAAPAVAAMDNTGSGEQRGTAVDRSMYKSCPVVSCFGSDPTTADIADSALGKLARFWAAPPLPAASVGSVAVASLLLPDRDGTQVPDLQ